MIIFGYAKAVQYSNDGTCKIQVRIPSIHGPYKQIANSKNVYVRDDELPWLTSVLLPHMPSEGEVVMLESINDSISSEYVVIGLTGGSYYTGVTLS